MTIDLPLNTKMSLIVVMEDDETLRLLITSVLKKYGHKVLSADNGEDGLSLVRLHKPDLVVSDVQMPRLDGFAMIAQLRQEPDIAATPVILLTSLTERAHMRIGMTAGADDYLVKPFRPADLANAVRAQLDKREMDEKLQRMAVNAALSTQKDSLAARYEQRLIEEINGRWSSNLDNEEDAAHGSATVVVVELISPELPALLSNTELTDIVKRAYRSAGDTMNLFSAQHIQLVGERLLAVFHDSEKTVTATHRFNAVRAAFGLVDSVGQIGQHLKVTYAERKLPHFDVRVALHTGPVTIARLTDPLSVAPPMVLALGNTVNLALLLHKHARNSAWLVTASTSALSGLREDALAIRGKARVQLQKDAPPLDIVELTSLTPSSKPQLS